MSRLRIVGINGIRKDGRIEYYSLNILFRLMMDYIYRNVIATTYAYMGFDFHPSVPTKIVSWIVLFIGAKLVLKAYQNHEKAVSYEVVFLLFFMSFVPFTSMIGFGALKSDFVICNTIFWFLLMFFSVTITKKGILQKKTNFKIALSDVHLRILAFIFAIIVLYVSGRYAHFRMNFNLLDVYELRADARNNNLPLWLTYIFSWSRTLNPILIAYFIRQKKKKWAIGCCIIQLLSFGYDGSKSTLFLLILSICISILPSFEMNSMNKWALRGITALITLLVLHFIITKNYVPISILIRRVFYLPVRISKEYFDFFTRNQPDYFRQSFLRYLGLKSPYSVSIPFLIGGEYFNAPTMSANNGLIADAITNLGHIGIVIYPIFLSFVFRMLDKSAANLDSRIYVTVGIYLSLVMTNSFIFTILFTHGLIIAMIVLRLMKRDKSVSDWLSELLMEG